MNDTRIASKAKAQLANFAYGWCFAGSAMMDCRRLFITGGNFPLTVPLPSAVFWGQTPFEARKHWVKRGLLVIYCAFP